MSEEKEPFGHYRQRDVGLMTTNTIARVEDFQRTFRPIPFMNSASLVCGSLMSFGQILFNYTSYRPLQAGAHRTIGLFCAGYTFGYYLARYRMMLRMGRLKYAIDYMEEHKDKFPPKEPLRFSDPRVLTHWIPIR